MEKLRDYGQGGEKIELLYQQFLTRNEAKKPMLRTAQETKLMRAPSATSTAQPSRLPAGKKEELQPHLQKLALKIKWSEGNLYRNNPFK